jgi:hypothetical protein
LNDECRISNTELRKKQDKRESGNRGVDVRGTGNQMTDDRGQTTEAVDSAGNLKVNPRVIHIKDLRGVKGVKNKFFFAHKFSN